MAVIIAFFIAIIINLEEDRKKFCLDCLWFFAHITYMLLAFACIFIIMPACIPSIDKIWGNLFTSAAAVIWTVVFLLVVKSYTEEPTIRSNRNTQELSQNTTSSEVPSDVICVENESPPPSYSELHTAQEI
jgi:hypothetical protein